MYDIKKEENEKIYSYEITICGRGRFYGLFNKSKK